MEPITEEQNNYLQETLQRAEIFETMIRHPAWVYIRAYIENNVKTFSTRLINEDMDEKTMLVEKGKIKGLLSLLAEVENSLNILKAERAKKKTETTPGE